MKFVIVVDMQNDFITGPLSNDETKEVYERMRVALPNLCDDNTLVIFTRDTHYKETYMNSIEGKKLPIEHCIEGTEGWEIAPYLLDVVHKWNYFTLTGKPVIVDKNTFGAAVLPNMIEWWAAENEVEEITIVGVCTDICVISNALLLKSYFPEAVIKVPEMLCAGTTSENHCKACDIMKQCHIEIV